ncbi:unnamed protein product [Rotaria sordida]|uniref:EGF-like domain-containing protein n=1 Tax=Rotaria sordida TaxID=392033 RepID=A0A815EIM3_9BILA|nr:unnamed protein product [Rotaria sordida]
MKEIIYIIIHWILNLFYKIKKIFFKQEQDVLVKNKTIVKAKKKKQRKNKVKSSYNLRNELNDLTNTLMEHCYKFPKPPLHFMYIIKIIQQNLNEKNEVIDFEFNEISKALDEIKIFFESLKLNRNDKNKIEKILLSLNIGYYGLFKELDYMNIKLCEMNEKKQFQCRKPYIETKIFTFTIYQGINCQPLGVGLDWRHICNDLIDCEDGEDEIHRHLLELNECDLEHEFRCKSGMCIEKSFAFDFTLDCLDGSDEVDVNPFEDCFRNPSMDCEEYDCTSRNTYPCGDGECVRSATDESTKEGICLNGRNKWFLSTYVNKTKNFCQACLLCYLNKPFDIPFETFIPTLKECQNLLSNSSCQTECQDFLLFDSSLFYPDVRFFYASTRNKIPKLTCYDNDKYLIYDCPTSVADEEYKGNICQKNLSSRFQCLTSNDCILRDDLYYPTASPALKNGRCKDKSDRVYPFICEQRNDMGCHHRRGFQISSEYFLFQEICNGQIHPELIEDENNCDEWQRNCNLKYRQCDGIINCFDQLDERSCYNSPKICQDNEISIDCISYPDPLAKPRTCLPISWIKNGKIECFGGVDEDINYCARNYPNNVTTRFHCFNDSKCIPLQDLCDGIFHCPYHDDETICPNRINSTKCSTRTYFCNERTCALKHIRCDRYTNCYDSNRFADSYSDETFCSLVTKPAHYKIFSLDDHRQYPSVTSQVQTINTKREVRVRCSAANNSTLNIYRCHRGIVVKSSIDGEQCLCSPPYYGQTCEYQSERISIVINIQSHTRQQSSDIVYKLLIRLQTFSNMFFDYTELYYLTILDDLAIYKQVVYLRAPRNVPLGSNIISFSKTPILPTFVFVEIYFDTNNQKYYHLVALMKKSVSNIVTSILPSNRCSRIDEFLDSFIMSLPYIRRIKYYNRPCFVLGTRCFYDEFYICLCDNNDFLDCVRFNHSASHCSTAEQICLNGGQCYQPIQTTVNFEFACVCPRCYFGDQCQFTMTKYTISLDSLLDQQILIGKSLSQQLPIIRWIFAMVVILIIVGFVANGLSILTFAQNKPRELGCG